MKRGINYNIISSGFNTYRHTIKEMNALPEAVKRVNAHMKAIGGGSDALLEAAQRNADYMKMVGNRDALLEAAQRNADYMKMVGGRDALLEAAQRNADYMKMVGNRDALLEAAQRTADYMKMVGNRDTFLEAAKRADVAYIRSIGGGGDALLEAAQRTVDYMKVVGGRDALLEASKRAADYMKVVGGRDALLEAAKRAADYMKAVGGSDALFEVAKRAADYMKVVGGRDALLEAQNPVAQLETDVGIIRNIDQVTKKESHAKETNESTERFSADDIEQMKELFKSVLEESGLLSNQATIKEGVDNLVKEQKKAQLINFIMGIIVNILSFYITLLLPVSPITEPNQISTNESVTVVNKEYLQYGFVTSKSLVLRQGAHHKSRSIGELTQGTIVKIIERKKDWTLVEWKEDEASISGWVYTRYVTKFK
ncbi:SH3 domain-containing protein [Brevibacillus dissolubilis]|uniref:SH3 domain-containing protein n=1 Tax=Brevibacillus dissolubilis TaxID=1844116 RepID=UPI001117425B|nr:SH3 domain-containing protein [Brevibacillus dissolubilis]